MLFLMKLPNYCMVICPVTAMKIQYTSDFKLEFADKLQSQKEA